MVEDNHRDTWEVSEIVRAAPQGEAEGADNYCILNRGCSGRSDRRHREKEAQHDGKQVQGIDYYYFDNQAGAAEGHSGRVL